jgi:hypothetical protein
MKKGVSLALASVLISGFLAVSAFADIDGGAAPSVASSKVQMKISKQTTAIQLELVRAMECTLDDITPEITKGFQSVDSDGGVSQTKVILNITNKTPLKKASSPTSGFGLDPCFGAKQVHSELVSIPYISNRAEEVEIQLSDDIALSGSWTLVREHLDSADSESSKPQQAKPGDF